MGMLQAFTKHLRWLPVRTSGQPLGRPFPPQHSWNGTRPENSVRTARAGAIVVLETGKGLSNASEVGALHAWDLEQLLKGRRKPLADEVLTTTATGGHKYDGGKSPVYRGFVQYFPRAIRAVADVSAFGANKYKATYEGSTWPLLNPGQLSDAEVRHMLDLARGETLAPDSNLKHLAHKAWNAMATLEIALREEEKNVIA